MKMVANDVTLLEIGAGKGAFIKRVVDLIPKKNVLCIEYSDYGRKEINKEGTVCLSEDIRDLDYYKFASSFDVICMFQVLEHMDGLDALFDCLTYLAKDNASIFISAPNQKRIEFNELNEALLDMPPNHIGRWSRLCFETIAKRYGWSVARYEIEPESFVSKTKRFAIGRYFRKRQNPDTVANKIERANIRFLRRFLQVRVVGIYALVSPIALYNLRSGELGNSSWVHLKKHNVV